jgi:hypothetical protein
MYAMPPILIACPVSGNLIPTGSEANRLGEASKPGVVLDCPDCGQDHEWDARDAVFAAAAT